jgi:MarR family transcriptional regulator, transcriptional regulator for hemolysin
VAGPYDRETAAGLGSLGYRLALIARQARAEFERRLGQAGASFATWTVLETLAVRGPMIQRDLAGSLQVSGQTMTRLVDRMAAAGWLRRTEVKSDRRATCVALTAAGTTLHRRLAEVARQTNTQLVAGLSPGDIATLDALLDRLAVNIGATPAHQPESLEGTP